MMMSKYLSETDPDMGFKTAMLANANRGGENVATGALIGAMLGAQCGYSGLPTELVEGLADHDQIAQEVERFIAAVPFVSPESQL
jgi:ADP-ribosylglycohydrolase